MQNPTETKKVHLLAFPEGQDLSRALQAREWEEVK